VDARPGGVHQMHAIALTPGLTLTLSSPSCFHWTAHEDCTTFLLGHALSSEDANPRLSDKVESLRSERGAHYGHRAAGMWKQMKGKVKQQWGKLTDDDLKQLEGHSEQLAGKLQERSRNNWN